MNKIITCDFGKNLIAEIANYLQDNFLKKNKDLNKIAVIFSGKRPELFLKKELAARINNNYFPPCFFSIDNFIHYILSKTINYTQISSIDACYIIYQIILKNFPQILRGMTSFSMFLPWTREIASFIDELDIEDIENKNLKNIQSSAAIGYDVPESINILLQNIITIRDNYHYELNKRNAMSRGLIYNKASKIIHNIDLNEFENIIFCNLFYTHKTEQTIIKNLYNSGKTILFFQKDNNDWNSLKSIAKALNCDITSNTLSNPAYNIEIYKGFDTHSQVGIVRSNILKKIKDINKTVVVLPDPGTLIPLLSEITFATKEFNVSMGYPLKRSSVYALFKSIITAQKTKKDETYYTKDYLKVLLHPLIKNLNIISDPSITRVLNHKIEEILLGIEKTDLSNNIFVNLDLIENSQDICRLTQKTLIDDFNNQNFSETEKIKDLLIQLHNTAFRIWENINNFSDLCYAIDSFLYILINKSTACNYPLNSKIIEKIYDINDRLRQTEFINETFDKNDIFKIFDNMLERELISFKGSPLKGLQILGLLETRALSFENVIIMDANESLLPKLKPYEPLIPGQVMTELGLNRLEQEEEIQRYHFMRLIASAKNVYITYDNSEEKEKSRFIQQLIWNKQKEQNKIDVLPQLYAKFNMQVLPKKEKIKKTTQILNFLENIHYSPSSIDTYIACPMRFYYQYVLGLKEKEEILDEPAAKDIGNFMHKFLENIYLKFINIKPIFDNKFENSFFKEFNTQFDRNLKKMIGSDAFMVKDVISYRLKKFLYKEAERNIKKILSVEDPSFGQRLQFKKRNIQFKCRIDRIDQNNDNGILIIDYKTGGSAKTPVRFETLKTIEFNRETIKDKIHSFQLPLYYQFAKQKYKDTSLNAALYNLRQADLTFLFRGKEQELAEDIIKLYMDALEFIIEEIMDEKKDFEADESNEGLCEYCPFFYMCR